jgi:hypothetical protein
MSSAANGCTTAAWAKIGGASKGVKRTYLNSLNTNG